MTIQELERSAAAAYEKGKAALIESETLEGEAKSAKEAEAEKFFDEAEATMKRAHLLHRQDRVGSRVQEIKAPVRAVQVMAADSRDTAADAAVELKALDAYLRSPKGWRARLEHDGIDAAAIKAVEKKALSSISGPEGGWILNQDVRTDVLTVIRDEVMIESLATVINTMAADVKWPTATIKNSNVQLPRRVADQAHAVQNLSQVFGKLTFTPVERSAIFKVPISLIEDEQFDVIAWLISEIGLEVGEMKELDYLYGTGAAQPLGLLSDRVAAVITQKDIAGATNAIVAEDILNAIYAMRMSHRRGAAIMMHRNTVLAIRKMRDNIGGAGTGQFLWQPGLTAGAPATIAGLPLIESEWFTDPFAPGAADGDAMLMVGNFKSYWIVNRLDLAVQRLEERYADEGMVGLLFRLRYDAAPVRAESFVRLNRN